MLRLLQLDALVVAVVGVERRAAVRLGAVLRRRHPVARRAVVGGHPAGAVYGSQAALAPAAGVDAPGAAAVSVTVRTPAGSGYVLLTRNRP